MNTHQPIHTASISVDAHSVGVEFVFPTGADVLDAIRGGDHAVVSLTIKCIKGVTIDGDEYDAAHIGIDTLRAIQDHIFSGGALGN